MNPTTTRDGVLVLEDGAIFHGRLLSPGRALGEVVFNTAMSGYQEVVTDPSYRGQIVVMTQPHMGNYGVDERFEESSRPWLEGFVAREITTHPTGVGSEPFPDYLERHRIPAIDGIDTRALVRRIRESGAMRGAVAAASELDQLSALIEATPPMVGRALVHEVTCEHSYTVAAAGRRRARVAVFDLGVKRNIVRCLAERGAEVVVLPASTPADDCLELGVDGVVLSNGPGDPEPLADLIDTVRQLIAEEVPLFGICLGHQLLGLALGARTFKLKFGHHGANQPVLDVDSGTVAITSQNHGFALDPETLPAGCRVIATNLNDGTVEAFEVTGRDLFAVQYHPEAAPGPHEEMRLFEAFLRRVGAET